MVDSDTGTARNVRRVLGAEALSEEGRRATFLGADFAAGRRRRTWQQSSQFKKRLWAAGQRKQRVLRLWKAAGNRASKIAKAGLLPQAGLGTAITGLSNTSLDELRRFQEVGTGGRRRGRNMYRQRLVGGDMASLIAAEPILEWAREAQAMSRAQAGSLTRGELTTIWLAGNKRRVTRWADTKGPVDVTRLTVQRHRWQWTAPWLMVNDIGHELDLTVASPRLVKWHLKESIRRQQEAKVGKDMATKGWTDTGQSLSSAIVRRVLNEAKHNNAGKGIARAVAIGNWWTTGCRSKAGYQIDNKCPLCGSTEDDDSIWHRLWRCPATKDLRQQPGIAKVAGQTSNGCRPQACAL